MEFIFEWDAYKAQSNVRRHGISFEEAKTVFNDPLLLTYPDDFHSETEDRLISIGYSGRQRLLLVVHTERDQANALLIRIISSRKATTAERKTYEEST
ncbi:MAG: BrnT family toxin [Caldilineaceae bacterium]